MVSINYTVFVQMVNFILLIFILNALLYKPILGILEKRKLILDGAQEDIRRMNEEVDRKMSEYEEKVRQAKIAAQAYKNALVTEGAEAAKSLIEAVRVDLPSILEEFHGKIEKEINEAKKLLSANSRIIAMEIAEKVLERRIQ